MLLDWIKQDLRWTASLASTTAYDQETGAALFGVLAELAQLAGWVATDLGQRALGQRYLLSALRFAHAAGDTDRYRDRLLPKLPGPVDGLPCQRGQADPDGPAAIRRAVKRGDRRAARQPRGPRPRLQRCHR